VREHKSLSKAGIFFLPLAQTVGMKIFKYLAAVCAAVLCIFPFASCANDGSSTDGVTRTKVFENTPNFLDEPDFAPDVAPDFIPDFTPDLDGEEPLNDRESMPPVKPVPPARHHGGGRDKMPTPPYHGSDEYKKEEHTESAEKRTADDPDSNSDESSKNDRPLRPEPRFKFRKPPKGRNGR
jgi:hypothetical protein